MNRRIANGVKAKLIRDIRDPLQVGLTIAAIVALTGVAFFYPWWVVCLTWLVPFFVINFFCLLYDLYQIAKELPEGDES